MKKTVFAAIAAAVLASCTPSTDALKDQSFALTELNGTEYVSFGEQPAVIVFQDGRVNANLGGNSISADYKLGKDGAITLTQGASTKMLVPEEIREDEFVDALNSVKSFTLEGDVVTLIDKAGNAVIKAAKVQ